MKKSDKFYKRKELPLKSKNDKKYGILIVGLLFLCVIMVGLLINRKNTLEAEKSSNVEEASNSQDVKSSNEEHEAVNENEEPSVNKTIDDVPSISGQTFNLTAAEIDTIKSYIVKEKDNLMILVNKNHVISEMYGSNNLVVPHVKLQKGRDTDESKVNEQIASDLEAMFSAAESEGVDLLLNSGYRSFETQKIVYQNELNQHGGEDSGYVAKPGTSEHQTGLAVDLTSSDVNMNLSEDFKDAKSGQWLFNNAYKFGFILRYDKSKEEETGYKYEPWHYRYIGNREVSKLCHDKNLTLEDLYEVIK